MAEQAIPLAQKAAQLFSERGIDNPRLEAELLLAHVLGIKRLDLYLQFDRPLTEKQLEDFRALVRRRLKREPLQYITGRVQFRELELRVDRRALIPRPETEVLVGVVLDYARGRGAPLECLDIGTGTGAIALSIAREAESVSVTATDISAEALALARNNAEDNGITIDYAQGFLWDAVPAGRRFDIIVSNPPYVGETERAALQPEVREWEPEIALFAGADGLAVLQPLIEGAARQMRAGGLLALEIGVEQVARVRALVALTESFEKIEIVRDLSGRERIIKAISLRQEA